MEIIVIMLLSLLNGFFALSEIALVSLKRSRIQHLAAQGSARAKTVLELLDNPENFLSSVQVGITLIGIVAGAYGGATLTQSMEQFLSQYSFFGSHTHLFSLIVVVSAITFISIVIGELVPKSIAMNHAESIALFTVPVIKYFTLATYPFVWLLSFSTKMLLKLFGIKENNADKVSEEELRFMLKTANKQGVLQTEENEVHQNLFAFTDHTAKALFTHRTEVEWIDCNDPLSKIAEELKNSTHSKYIVADGGLDNIKGVVTIKDFFEKYTEGGFELQSIIREPIYITENTNAFALLNLFKTKKQYIALVVDEYGSFCGLVTLHDLFEALVGDLPDEDENSDPAIVKKEENHYLIDGKTMVYEFNQYFQKEIIATDAAYSTVAGFIQQQLEKLPYTGAKVEYDNLRFTVIDMDGLRIDKIEMEIIPSDPL